MRCLTVAAQECPVWAESGECVVNPSFMVGDKNNPGSCLASCGRCDLLPDPTKAAGPSRKLKQ
jgi:prolyl 4-hydroxylase